MVEDDESIGADFVKTLIEDNGVIKAIKLMEKSFGDGMNQKILDEKLRLSIWQITHSMERFEEYINSPIESVSQIEQHVIDEYESVFIIAKHLINSFDKLQAYTGVNKNGRPCGT